VNIAYFVRFDCQFRGIEYICPPLFGQSLNVLLPPRNCYINFPHHFSGADLILLPRPQARVKPAIVRPPTAINVDIRPPVKRLVLLRAYNQLLRRVKPIAKRVAIMGENYNVGWDGGAITRRHERVRFSPISIVLSVRRFAPHPISPVMPYDVVWVLYR